ncbi:MAG: FxsA family protein [Gemmatimonadota bacterium]|nr:MAG: FxsA family protein [Gemmatimonadota bacterium]
MFRRLLLLFIVVPIIELALLIQMGRWVGLWPTLGLIVATGILGAALASHEGLRAWRAFQEDLVEGRVPGRSILDGLSILAGGALLLTPGLLTDLLGFTLVARPTRRWLQDRLVNRFGGRLIRSGRVYVKSSFDRKVDAGVGRKDEYGRPAGREIESDGDI